MNRMNCYTKKWIEIFPNNQKTCALQKQPMITSRLMRQTILKSRNSLWRSASICDRRIALEVFMFPIFTLFSFIAQNVWSTCRVQNPWKSFRNATSLIWAIILKFILYIFINFNNFIEDARKPNRGHTAFHKKGVTLKTVFQKSN